jgi:hypothetical protein
MRSLCNPNRFLRSIQHWYWGNPQPTQAYKRRLAASFFTSTNKARRKVPKRVFTILRSRP